MLSLFKELRLSLRARLAAYWVKRERIRATKALHLMDLAQNPVSMAPMLKAQHAVELRAIRAGQLAFVDRRTKANTGIPAMIQRINQPVPKNAPLTLRQFSRTPIPARAINIIKAGLLNLKWDIKPFPGKADDSDPDVKARIQIAKNCFDRPNDDDSFRTLLEQTVTDFCIFGMGALEIQDNPFDDRPFKMWAFDSSTLQVVMQWTEDKSRRMPRYAQVPPYQNMQNETRYLLDENVIAVRDNIATDIPFGTGSLEIAHKAVKDLLSIQRMAGAAGANQPGHEIFWWSGALPPSTIKDMRDYLQGELEGMARVGMIGGAPKPEVITITPTKIEDLLLPMQEMLIRLIAASFNMSAMSLNVERDVNRSTGEVLDDKDFRTAVVPVAIRFAEAFTRNVLAKKLGWDDLQMLFLGLDDPDIETRLEILTTRYSSNAATGNDINRALGIEPIDSPFADLTSFELIILQGIITQLTRPQQQQQAPGEGQEPFSDGFSQPVGLADGGPAQKMLPAPKGPQQPKQGQLQQPKTPALRQFSAQQFLMLPVPMIRALQALGQLPQTGIGLADQLDQEQPDILDQLSDQVFDYIEKLAEREIDRAKTSSKKAKLNKKWTNLAKKRYGSNAKRVATLGPQSLVASAGGNSQKRLGGFDPNRRKITRESY